MTYGMIAFTKEGNKFDFTNDVKSIKDGLELAKKWYTAKEYTVVFYAFYADDVDGEEMAKYEFKDNDFHEIIKLYHGSDEIVGNKILAPAEIDYAYYGMFFSDSLSSAKSHGDNIVSIEINEDDILDVGDIWWEDEIKQKAIQFFGGIIDNELLARLMSEREDFYDCEIDEKDIIALNNKIADVTGVNFFYGERDLGMLGWALQSAACYVAQQVGYKGVTTNDEHGLSFCLVPGLEFVKEV